VTEQVCERAPRSLKGDAGQAAGQLDDRLFIACGLAWLAALIHVRAAIDHFGEYAPYAILFAVLAVAQLAWGAALYRHSSRRLAQAGVALSVCVVAVWIVSRTTGLPIGPEPWRPEEVGPIDSIATANEIVLSLLVVLHFMPAVRLLQRTLRPVATAVGLLLILLSSVALVLVGHAR
jgi:hypothetical protein